MSQATYEFDGVDTLSAAGAAVSIPAGIHLVERRSLVHRLRLGGRQVDLTLAEFDRLLHAGRVRPTGDASDAGRSDATPSAAPAPVGDSDRGPA